MSDISWWSRAPLKALVLAGAGALALSCGGGGGGGSASGSDGGAIAVPEVTLSLPASLTAGQPLGAWLQSRAVVAEVTECAAYFDADLDPLAGSHEASRYLVGMAQMQACSADFVLSRVMSAAASYVNSGVVTLPVSSDETLPTHLRVESLSGGNRAWLYYAAAGLPLPPDVSTTRTLYVSWSDDGSTLTGQLYSVNQAAQAAQLEAPWQVRVDFTRDAGGSRNQVYFGYAGTHPQRLSGARVDVVLTGSGATAQYTMQAKLEFTSQPSANLPGAETFPLPVVALWAQADATGAGVATMQYGDYALHIGDDRNDDGDFLDVNEFNLGSYLYDVADTQYFTAGGASAWRDKRISAAGYVNDSGTNLRAGSLLNTMLNCFEMSGEEADIFCDFGSPGNPVDGVAEFPGLDLGGGYFSATCADSHGAECTAYIQGVYDVGWFGVPASDSPLVEPNDERRTALLSATYLADVWPQQSGGGAGTALSTFAAPSP